MPTGEEHRTHRGATQQGRDERVPARPALLPNLLLPVPAPAYRKRKRQPLRLCRKPSNLRPEPPTQRRIRPRPPKAQAAPHQGRRQAARDPGPSPPSATNLLPPRPHPQNARRRRRKLPRRQRQQRRSPRAGPARPAQQPQANRPRRRRQQRLDGRPARTQHLRPAAGKHGSPLEGVLKGDDALESGLRHGSGQLENWRRHPAAGRAGAQHQR
uniref:(northern house mosquito) hypothetical protein n=1 Tax=Culex pipiens TaxID=7175 RepID=A0A8D8KKP6_CULPI